MHLQVEDDGEAELEPADGFQRMLAHGLSEYHGLTTLTRTSTQQPAAGSPPGQPSQLPDVSASFGLRRT